MQTIWARVAQTRSSCHCPSCVSPTQALTRRSTTAPPRRRLRFRDVCTAFYSAALATAAVADGNSKESRRQDLDKSINQAKSELQALKEAQDERLQALASATNNADKRDESKEDYWAGVFQWEAEEKERRAALGFQDLKGLPLSILERITKIELDEILLEDQQEERLNRRLRLRNEQEIWQRDPHLKPLSPKKMKLLEWSVAKMGLRMLHSSANEPASQNAPRIATTPSGLHIAPRSTDFSRELEVVQERICSLRATSSNSRKVAEIESPRYPRYIATQHVNPEDPRSLNGSIRDTFQSIRANFRYEILQTKKPRIESLVAEICYTLFTSSAAPNVHTYNLLLIHLLRLELYDLARLVIDSISETYTKPNEVTVRMHLAFYRVVRDSAGFIAYVDKMRGKNGGLALAHPRVKITAVNERHYRRSSRSVHYGKDDKTDELIINSVDPIKHGRKMKIVERAHRNQEVFDELIKGALESCGQEKAMKYYRSMIEEGWEANGTVLGCILKHCSKTLDWSTAELLWQRLRTLSSPMIKTSYLVMLRLCLAHDQQHMYNDIRKAGLDKRILSHSEDYVPTFAPAKLSAMQGGLKRVRQLELRMEFVGWKICYTATKLSNIKGMPLRDSTLEKRIHADMKELNLCLAVGLENTTLIPGTAANEQRNANVEQELSQGQCNVHHVTPPVQEPKPSDHLMPDPVIQGTADSCSSDAPLLDF